MAEFVDYYAELELDPSLDCSQIEKELKNLRKKWRTRQNASDLSERQKAELKSKYIDEAWGILTDQSLRDKYDNDLIKFKHSQQDHKPTSPNKTTQTNTQKIDYNNIDELIKILEQLVAEERISDVRRFTFNVINNYGVENYEIYYWYECFQIGTL